MICFLIFEGFSDNHTQKRNPLIWKTPKGCHSLLSHVLPPTTTDARHLRHVRYTGCREATCNTASSVVFVLLASPLPVLALLGHWVLIISHYFMFKKFLLFLLFWSKNITSTNFMTMTYKNLNASMSERGRDNKRKFILNYSRQN